MLLIVYCSARKDSHELEADIWHTAKSSTTPWQTRCFTSIFAVRAFAATLELALAVLLT